MTQLKRKVRREVPTLNKIKPYIIQLEPPVRDEPAVVKIKQKGSRTWYETTVDAIFWMAVRRTAERLREERRLKKLARKAGR
jgi:hypothetical protein